MSHEPIVFDDLAAVEIPVSIPNKDGVKEDYILQEASGDAACKYRNAMLACTQLGPEGKPSQIRGMADIEPLLVSLCLFTSERKPVQLGIIRSWPNRVQKKLFDKIKEISDLDESEDRDSLVKQRKAIDKQIAEIEEEAAKNSPSNTTDGLR